MSHKMLIHLHVKMSKSSLKISVNSLLNNILVSSDQADPARPSSPSQTSYYYKSIDQHQKSKRTTRNILEEAASIVRISIAFDFFFLLHNVFIEDVQCPKD